MNSCRKRKTIHRGTSFAEEIEVAFFGADRRANFGLAVIQSHGLLDLPAGQPIDAFRYCSRRFYLPAFRRSSV